MNLWERAKAELRVAYYNGDHETTERVVALLAEMERVECVEGSAESFSLDGSHCGWEWSESELPGSRPAILLVRKESDNG